MSQQELFPEVEAKDRALIERLIAATRLYSSSTAVQELIDFTVRLRRFAPFNALLLHIQKPGLTYAASAQDWHRRFGRVPVLGARPLLILRTMGPVDFVFDVMDTEGRALPEGAFSFPTLGNLSERHFSDIVGRIESQDIRVRTLDHGDASAGWIRCIQRPPDPRTRGRYELGVNRNHPAPTRLVTLAHELAHLFLGHMGADGGHNVRDRRDRSKAQREVEAEMAAYLVAKRNGLTPRSETYFAGYQGGLDKLDLFAVTRAANAIETIMGVAAHQLESRAS